MLRPRDPRVPADAAHSRRHASVKEWEIKMQAFWNSKTLEAFTVGRCLVDHLGRRIKGLVRITEYFPFSLYFDRLVDRRRA